MPQNLWDTLNKNNLQFDEDWVRIKEDYAFVQYPDTGRIIARVNL